MATPISSDSFPAHQRIEQRNPDVNRGHERSTGHTVKADTRPSAEQADIGRAHQRMSLESGDVRESSIGAPKEAKHRAALLKDLLTDSPAAALKAHGNIDRQAFEAAMARPTA